VYSLAESLARDGIQEKIQDALKAERDEIVGRGRYERHPSSVYRNGYHKPRCLVCGCGGVEVRVPRLEAYPFVNNIFDLFEHLGCYVQNQVYGEGSSVIESNQPAIRGAACYAFVAAHT
jgi:hypothetical protein